MDSLIVLVLLFGGLAVFAYSSVVERMAEARIAHGKLWIGLRGMNKVWAMRSELVIPLESVREVRVDPLPQALTAGLRLPGTWVPGLLVAGSYRRPGFRSFLAVRHGRAALVLELEDHEYDRVVVDVDEPELVAEQIEAARRQVNGG